MSRRLLILVVITASVATGVKAQNPRQGQAQVLKACKPDIARFCSKVPPGQGRIKECMKAHLPELSEPCKEQLFQTWLHQ
jgi:hypothetical protein